MGDVGWLSIVGIGEGGWSELGDSAKNAIASAEILIGAKRHLGLIPQTNAKQIIWPSPMLPFVEELIANYRGRPVCVLASGDPLLFGVGATFARVLPASELRFFPTVSAFALACARLAWPEHEVVLVSSVARPIEECSRYFYPQRRIIVYSQDGMTPAGLAERLREHGYGATMLHVFEHLGGAQESVISVQASASDIQRCADLNVIAMTCVADPEMQALGLGPGLPDHAYESDGQFTKREVRAATLARLAPGPNELLWDVGAGTGTIAIEWMRADPSCRAIAFEQNPERAERIARNARHLGVPRLRIVHGSAPDALSEMQQPNAIFIGGGITTPGVTQACWEALRPGGRLVANAVTIEAELELLCLQKKFGGELVRISLSRAEPIGSMLCWRPQLPIVQWAVRKT